MPPQPVTTKRQTVRGIVEEHDALGGLFTPIQGKGQRPVYTANAKDAPMAHQLVLLQCPQSAIPGHVWELFALWWHCKQMNTLPMAGGYLDQPLSVRIAFPVLEQEYAQVRRKDGADVAERAAGLALGSMVKLMRG